MSFTTSFFAVSSPAGQRREKQDTMDVDDDTVNEAGARMGGTGGDTTDEEEPVQVPGPSLPQPANTNTTNNFSTSTHISSSPQKEGDSRSVPDKPKTLQPPQHPNPDSSETATTMPKKAPIKKKGTASAIKPPKRRGGKSGSSSGVKKPSSSSKASTTVNKQPKKPKPERTASQAGGSGSSPAPPSSDAGAAAASEEEESGSDQGIYCICRGPDNHRFMIACDVCEDWFHGDCIGMDKYTGEVLVQRYICPNCTDGKLLVTRYKKTCALERCDRPARMYGDDIVSGGKEASIFCSEEHCQMWWERLVGTLPKRREGGVLYGDVLTQEEFMGLLGTGKKGSNKGWKIGDEPFGVPDNFWETTPPTQVLTQEELTLLQTSSDDRHSLGEEIVLCKKMLQLIDMAVKQREQLVASSQAGPKSQLLGKDFCGYDYRLDAVGATACFAAFVKGPAGEAIFRSGRLPLPGDEGFLPAPPDGDGYVDGGAVGHVNGNGVNGGGAVNGNAAAGVAALAGVMCVRRKCKPHAGWSGIHTKNVKHQIKELAAQAKEKLDFEARIRDCAAVRYQRKKRENNKVEVVDVEMEG